MRAVIMDCLLDLSLSSEDWNTVASTEDAVRFTTTVVQSQFAIEPQSEKDGFIRDLTAKLELFRTSKSISDTERLVRALDKQTSNVTDPHRQNVVISGNRIVVRIPDYPSENTGMTDNLGKMLRWATTVLGIRNPEIKTLRDPQLGNAITLQARLERGMDNMVAALTLPPSESGDRASFKTGLKANLVELLATIRLMRRYTGSLQKAAVPKGQKLSPVSLEDLRKSVNGRVGLLEHGILPFNVIFVKAVLNELTKPNFANFPGKWIHSLKETNNVKNNVGVIYKLGYELKVANSQKVFAVVMNSVRQKTVEQTKSSKKNKAQEEEPRIIDEVYFMNDKEAPDGITHREFRLGVMMLLPLIDPRAQKSPKDQLSQDPLSVKDKNITTFYSKHRKIVDAVNLAYATKQAIGKKDSKANPRNYKSARGHAIRLSAKCMFMDASGVEYQKFGDIPENTRGYLLKLLNRKLAVYEDAPSDDESGEEEEDEGATNPSTTKTTA
jgi:hypothetical protein